MEIVLGVSMTPTAIRMVAVEGDRADGVIVDHDVFEIGSADDATTAHATDHVVAALVGTRQSAEAAGHTLLSTGITCRDRHDAVTLRDALTIHGFVDVTIISEEVAAAALAQAAGAAIGDERTALLMIGPDTATLSVVQTDDGAVLDVRSRPRQDADSTVLADLIGGLDTQESPPGSLFVICPDSDVAALTAELGETTALPISAPEHSGLALARGAALASTHPSAEMLTMGLAYSLDTDSLVGAGSALAVDPEAAPRPRRPFLLVGSVLSVFVLGVAALVISVAVSVRLTSDQHAGPAHTAAAPPSVTPPLAPPSVPAPPKAAPAPVPPPPVAPRPSPPPSPAPVPMVQHKTSTPIHRTQVVKPPAPAPAAATPAPAAPPPPPVADPPVAPVPAAPPPSPQVPPILQRIFPFLRPPRYEQPAPYPDTPYQQYPGYGGGSYGSYPSYPPSYPSY